MTLQREVQSPPRPAGGVVALAILVLVLVVEPAVQWWGERPVVVEVGRR